MVRAVMMPVSDVAAVVWEMGNFATLPGEAPKGASYTPSTGLSANIDPLSKHIKWSARTHVSRRTANCI